MARYLNEYIARHNKKAEWFPKVYRRLTSSAITAADKTALLEELEGDLSPENISQDGELRGTKLQRLYKQFNGAKAELEALLPCDCTANADGTTTYVGMVGGYERARSL